MPSRKLTNANKVAILTDWLNSPTNRGDVLYYILTEIGSVELQNNCFYRGLLISVTPFDEFVGKVTFVDVLI